MTLGPGSAVAAPAPSASIAINDKPHSQVMSEMITNIKKSIVKGTNLWKDNKRDECFNLYLNLCSSTSDGVYCRALQAPLQAAVNTAHSQAGNKQKGAVGLRKALDKFLMDTQVPL